MKIAKYVGDLLFDYECVVVPGLGGFLTSDKAATVNSVSHHFKPPFRKVMFNVHLKANDGLLVNHIAQQEEVSYKVAKEKLDQFVHLCHQAIDDGKRVNFNGVGSVYKDKNNYIVFDQDERSNYYPDAFGMSSFISPAVRRTSQEQKIREFIKPEKSKKATDRKAAEQKPKKEKPVAPVRKKMQATRKRSTLQMQLTVLSLFAVAVLIYYAYSRRDAMSYYWAQYSKAIPAFYTSPNDYLEKNAGKIPASKIASFTAGFIPTKPTVNQGNQIIVPEATTNDTEELNKVIADPEADQGDKSGLDKDADFQPETDKTTEDILDVDYVQELEEESEPVIQEPEAVEPDRDKTIEIPKSTTNRFFIIAGSFKSENNALKLVKELQQSGFEALIADTNRYGMFRVAFMGFANKQEAENKLLAIRRENNGDAWILKK